MRDLPAAVEHFRSYYANAKPKRDWAAAWRLWCIDNKAKQTAKSGSRHGFPSGPRGAMEVLGTLPERDPAAEELADESGIIEGGEFGYETRH